MQAALLFLLFSFLIILGILISMLYVVRQQSVAIVERFGRYQKIATSGIHMRLPFGIDKIAARIQLRLLQSEIVVETKTKDNVFVMMNVATQYRVNEQNVQMLTINSCVQKLKLNHTLRMLSVHQFLN
jgi:regulator of protease activity HflC (stomatin/prohibitin superfamily)